MRRADEPTSMPNPVSAGAPRSYRRMYGSGHVDSRGGAPSYTRTDSHDSRRSHSGHENEEGVEVVLDSRGTKVVDSPVRGRRHDQNVFRPPPHPAHRPRPMRAPHGHGNPHGHPPTSNSGSYG